MGFFSDVFPDLAPILGSGVGSAAGGPVGGMIGGAVGQGIQNREEAKREQEKWDRNVAVQREFAQHGIRWKVEDAKAAGIHPLVALGAQPAQFSGYAGGSSSTGPDLASMGQDITRAISATSTEEQKLMQQYTIQSAVLDLQGKELDNAIKQTQLNKLSSPAFPGTENYIPGQGNSGIKTVPLERTASHAGAPHMEAGAINDLGYAKTATGMVPIPSKDVKERIEDNMPQEWSHYIRNNVSPYTGGGTPPPKSALPPGAKSWKWHPFKMEYQPEFPRKPKHPRFDKYLPLGS